MGMSDPKVFNARVFKEHFAEGEPFFLKAAKVVHTGDKTYEDDRMIVLTISREGEDNEYTLFGRYIVAQIENASPSDFGKPWKVVTAQPSEDKRPGKMLVPADEDIPF